MTAMTPSLNASSRAFPHDEKLPRRIERMLAPLVELVLQTQALLVGFWTARIA